MACNIDKVLNADAPNNLALIKKMCIYIYELLKLKDNENKLLF